MTKFTDHQNRQWEVNVSPYERDAVLHATGLDIYDLIIHVDGSGDSTASMQAAGGLLGVLESNDEKLRDVAWNICKGQAEEQDVSETSFKQSLYTTVLDDAQKALMQALAFFCRKPIQREFITRLLKLMEAAAEENETVELFGNNLEKAVKDFRESLKKQLANGATKGATKKQHLPESTQNHQADKELGDTRFANST